MNPKITSKKAIEKLESSYYDRCQRLKALKILNQLEINSSRKLDRLTKGMCDEYAVEVLGDRKYRYWLYVYSQIGDGFKSGWIPENYYVKHVVKKLKGLPGQMSGLRSLHRVIFGSDAFPDLGSYVNGLFFDENGAHVSQDKVSSMLFRGRSRVIYKCEESGKGQGIHFFTKSNFRVGEIESLGNGIFQSIVTQHPELEIYSTSSVSTLRITTVSTETGDVSARSSTYKVASAGATNVNSTNSVRTAVDIDSGMFAWPAYRRDWSLAPREDFGNGDPAGKVFPHFEEARDLVLKLHQKVPYVRCIGWDLVVDADGKVQIFEWNGFGNAIVFGEATQGPCFADLGWEKLWKLG